MPRKKRQSTPNPSQSKAPSNPTHSDAPVPVPSNNVPTPSKLGPSDSPITRLLSFLSSLGLSEAYILFVVLAIAWCIRAAVGLWPYSGENTPPLYGDFEAQRHWMELTLHVPINQWYFHDLKWWGLDYPPLTAYISWVCGVVGSWINPAWFALYDSRGLEGPELKLFMRTSVILLEFMIYVPAVIGFVRRCSKKRDVNTNANILLLLLQPSLLIIDHGHFQYNTVMLGLTLWAINFIHDGRFIAGSIAFCLSLAFKQMALYYAPVIFFFLLGKCFSLSPSAGLRLFSQLGLTVLATFGVVFSPFLRPDQLAQAIHRIFPVARGLYEDKVANLWCAANVIIKIRDLLSQEACMKLSLAATLLAISPSCFDIFRRPNFERLPMALSGSALAFFLFSFQVHEKSILLPLLPALLMSVVTKNDDKWAGIDRDIIAWYNNLAMFSMYPLLQREQLIIPYAALLSVWVWAGKNYPRHSPPWTRGALWVSHSILLKEVSMQC
ncbi:uncharacterized protein VTP21DRAFT_6783 [Calcarisporiella thermophila]|uniref:uncharacterized protein n=1 Tax=Calcarisporiella thermophila TaxID=911321 RepID=UPI003742EFC2